MRWSSVVFQTTGKMEWVLACVSLLAISALHVEGDNYGKEIGKFLINLSIVYFHFVLKCVTLLIIRIMKFIWFIIIFISIRLFTLHYRHFL